MNTNIHFQISAPASLSIFGEHTISKLRTSIDLRTALIFEESASLPNNIEINFLQINLMHQISLQEFINFYNNCVENINLLHEKVLQFVFQYESLNQDQKIFLQIFYYLLVFIKYTEEIEIKSFNILLDAQSISNGENELMSLASLKVCLAACWLHLSCLQKGDHSTFHEVDLNKIYIYATSCEKVGPKTDVIDIMVCAHGSIMKFDRERNKYEGFHIPSMFILLVDLNQKQDEIQKQRVAELMNTSPELANSILNNIDIVTNMAYDLFKQISYICEDKLNIEMKHNPIFQQQEALGTCTRRNHRLLQALEVSCIELDEICAIAQRHRLSGKYTDLGNGRYAYIWCPVYLTNECTSLKNELNIRDIKFIETYLLCTGVKID